MRTKGNTLMIVGLIACVLALIGIAFYAGFYAGYNSGVEATRKQAEEQAKKKAEREMYVELIDYLYAINTPHDKGDSKFSAALVGDDQLAIQLSQGNPELHAEYYGAVAGEHFYTDEQVFDWAVDKGKNVQFNYVKQYRATN